MTSTIPLIQKLAAKNAEYLEARRTLSLRLEAHLRAELAVIEEQRDALVVAADAAGIPRSTIAHEGLQTKSRGRVYQILRHHASRTERDAALQEALGEPTAAQSETFSLTEAGRVVVRPSDADLAPILEALGSGAGEQTEAEFEVVDGRLLAVTPAWTPEGRNPVVALVLAEGSVYRSTVMDWLRERGRVA